MVHQRENMTNALIRQAVLAWCRDREAAKKKYGAIEDWDTSSVTNMHGLFRGENEFNDNISRFPRNLNDE